MFGEVEIEEYQRTADPNIPNPTVNIIFTEIVIIDVTTYQM